MREDYTIVVRFRNGSVYTKSFEQFLDARDYYRNHISYTGGRIYRVEMHNRGGVRAVWDENWDLPSKVAGLHD